MRERGQFDHGLDRGLEWLCRAYDHGGQAWRPETIAGAETVDFEDALFLDAQSGWVGGNIDI